MNKQVIVLGGGCFWCTEAIFKKIKGLKVEPGYAGGYTENPTYEQVCSGKTGHAEVIKIEYGEEKTPLTYLLEVFFKIHDPTTIDHQGNDFGTEYRSIILYTDDKQKEMISKTIEKEQKELKDKIVTELKKLDKFYPAEKNHQDFYEKNKNQPYCRFVIVPKLEKFDMMKEFK